MNASQMWRHYKTSYRLEGALCVECGEKYLPPRPLCKKCHSQKMEPCTFSGDGTIVTWTRVHIGQPGLTTTSPYILAIVQLAEGPRITAQIVDADDVHTGQKVRMVFRKLSENGEQGVIRYGFKFAA